MLELIRPHGFLMWKGKKKAVLRPHGDPLLIGEELEVTTGDEAFGVAVLASPAQMLASEVDRKEYFGDHRVRPAEREEWWPGETKFLVYPVESFEAYKETAKPQTFGDLKEGGGNVPYEIEKRDGEFCVVKVDGEVEKCHPTKKEANAHLAALRKNVEAEEKGTSSVPPGATDVMMELARVAEKVAVELEKEAEPELSQEAKQRILDQVLEMEPDAKDLESDLEAETIPESDEGEKGQLKKLMQEVDALQDENAMLSVSLEAARKKASGERQGDEGADVCTCPDCEAEFPHKKGTPCAGAECPECDAATDDKAGRRVKKMMRKRLRDAWDVLGEVLKWAEGPQQEPTMADLFKAHPDAGFALKEVNGEPWMLTWSSNAFIDRDDEIFTTKGLEEYVLENEQKEHRGYYNFWHVPGTDFAEKQWQGVIGRFLVEAGPFLDTPRGKTAQKFFTEFPNGHPKIAPEGWGSSVEYRYLPKEKKSGVYEKFWMTRTSTLPRLAAANVWTKGGTIMALTKKQREGLEAIFPDEAEAIVAEAESETKKLEDADVQHKSVPEEDEEKAMDAAKVAKAIQKLAGEADEALSAKLKALAKTLGEDEPEEEEEEEKASEPPVIDLEALGKEIAKQFDVQLEPLVEMQKQAAAQQERISELEAQVAKDKKAEKVRQDEETPRFVLSLETKASEAEETVVDEDDPLLKMKPTVAKPTSGSGADNFFGPVKR